MISLAKNDRGSIGLIMLLIVLLIIGYLTIRNVENTAGNAITVPGNNEKMSPTNVLDKFKGEAKHIEEMQNQALPPLDGGVPTEK